MGYTKRCKLHQLRQRQQTKAESATPRYACNCNASWRSTLVLVVAMHLRPLIGRRLALAVDWPVALSRFRSGVIADIRLPRPSHWSGTLVLDEPGVYSARQDTPSQAGEPSPPSSPSYLTCATRPGPKATAHTLGKGHVHALVIFGTSYAPCRAERQRHIAFSFLSLDACQDRPSTT